MEMTTTTTTTPSHSITYAKQQPAPSFHRHRHRHTSLNFNCLRRNLKFNGAHLTITASSTVRWLLEPVGDGDSSHIGYKIAMPGAFEVASNAVTVGRVRERADVVIPVPTVSGLHARIEKTDRNLLITDLDSTNGTFINDTRLKPGEVSAALPGNKIAFGDTNLAIFRVYKLETDPKEADVDDEEEEVDAAAV